MTEQRNGQFRPDAVGVKILRRLAAGEDYDDIAAAEFMSSRTVRRVVSAIKRRVMARTVAALCAEATRRGWL